MIRFYTYQNSLQLYLFETAQIFQMSKYVNSIHNYTQTHAHRHAFYRAHAKSTFIMEAMLKNNYCVIV